MMHAADAKRASTDKAMTRGSRPDLFPRARRERINRDAMHGEEERDEDVR